MSTTLPTIERLLEPGTACLTPEVAQRIVDLRLDDPSTLERLDDLREKANEGTLTAEGHSTGTQYFANRWRMAGRILGSLGVVGFLVKGG